MVGALVCRMKPYIQPFERKLALSELASLAGSEPVAVGGRTKDSVVFSVPPRVRPDILARQLAYWEVIEADRRYFTSQVLRERTANAVRNGVPPAEIPRLLFDDQLDLPNRRCLRYGTHGIHEYRGKFFPQLVRCLINVGRVPTGGTVADPMCGSGTTIVEAVLGGYTGLGLDVNPLSVLMAQTKCALLSVDSDTLIRAYQTVRSQLLGVGHPRTARPAYFSCLPPADQRYLAAWFSDQVLQDLDLIYSTIQGVPELAVRDFFRLSLSNILRAVSWQKEEDLRVRKEIRLDAEIDPIREFLEELGRSARVVLAFLHGSEHHALGPFYVSEADAREAAKHWDQWKGRVDVVITSPPYATALPYIDTDRLSLSYLGLLSRPKHRRRDQDMIGNREITETQRRQYLTVFEQEKHALPRRIAALIERVSSLNAGTEAGFRRRNLPALLTKYFADMQRVFAGIADVLGPGRPAYIVIGNNHTVAGGQRVEIETATLLADLASRCGLTLEDRIPMEMLVSRDIFRRNAVASEEILFFRRDD
jgi:site-specific DNA-methyltransferase (cytosine-N4-specific)